MPVPLIEADKISVTMGANTVFQDLSLSIHEGEAWAITGPAGSGKTTLANVLRRRQPVSSGSLTSHLLPTDRVVMVEQQHTYRNHTDASSTYYQARFDSVGSEDFLTVEQVLKTDLAKQDVTPEDEEMDRVLSLLRIDDLRNTKLIQLSNGENKRFQLAKAVLQHPKVLILDSPFIGLDQEARQILHRIINQLIGGSTTVILITTPGEIPKHITHVLELTEDQQFLIESRASFLERKPKQGAADFTGREIVDQELLKTMSPAADDPFDVAIRMQNVRVRYGGKAILDGVDWQVNRGDKWSLSGPNGAGKSTLLSLIYGDNPQAYANSIYLFDRKRGSGESIWDIKRRIGYISPELHLYFNRRMRCFEAVASGYTDTMTAQRNLSDEQNAAIHRWLSAFQLSHRKETPLANMPLSEQRLVLLARALIKNPPVLLLDEPCQGLDAPQIQQFNSIVDSVCRYTNKTLIYVSHYRQEIPACVNQRLYLEQGKARVVSN